MTVPHFAFRCSACGGPLGDGARFCARCHLPVAAVAMPLDASTVRRRLVTLPALLWCACAAFWVWYWYASRPVRTPADDPARQAMRACFQRDAAPGGPLTQLEAFMNACGQPDVLQRLDTATVLYYRGHRAYFIPGHCVSFRNPQHATISAAQFFDAVVWTEAEQETATP